MSWTGDVLGAVKRVVLIEERVTRLDAGVDGLTAKLSDTRDRVIRLEGLIEGAVRTYRPNPATAALPRGDVAPL
jgi:hypothetical protein